MLGRLILSICSLAVFASTQLSAFELLAEVKAGYFWPSDKTFREIYGHGSGIVGAELSAPIWCSLYGFAGIDYFAKKGHSIISSCSDSSFSDSEICHNPTRIKLVPVTFGLKYFYCVDRYDIYVAGGAQYTYFQTKDESPFVIETVTKRGWGGIAKLGTLINFDCGLFLDVFGQYSFLRMDFKDDRHDRLIRHDAKLSGWSVGLGLGYRFGCN